MPLGQLPVLEYQGRKIVQSVPIAVHVADELGKERTSLKIVQLAYNHSQYNAQVRFAIFYKVVKFLLVHWF